MDKKLRARIEIINTMIEIVAWQNNNCPFFSKACLFQRGFFKFIVNSYYLLIPKTKAQEALRLQQEQNKLERKKIE